MAPSLDEMVSAGSDVRVLSKVMDRLVVYGGELLSQPPSRVSTDCDR